MKSDVSSAVRRSAAEHVTERVTCLLKTSSSSVELSVCTFKVKVDAHNEAYVDGSCYFSQQNWVLLPQFNTFAWILILKKSLRGGYRLATLTEDTQFQGLCVARKRVSEVIGLWGRVGQKELVSVQSQIFWSIGSQSRFWRHSDTGSSPDCPSAHSNTQQITDPNEYSCTRLWQRPDCAGLEKTLPQSSEDAFVSSFKKDAPYRQKQTLRKESINPSCWSRHSSGLRVGFGGKNCLGLNAPEHKNLTWQNYI